MRTTALLVTASFLVSLLPPAPLNGAEITAPTPIRISARDAQGLTSTVTHVVRLTGDMKVGNFSFTVEDL